MNNQQILIDNLDSLVLEPKGVAERSIIWLHGLGADGSDFEPIVPELNVQEKYKIRFIFPNAPSQPVTLNNGYIMPAWFDIYGIKKEIKEDIHGIQLANNLIKQLIEEEHAKGIPYENILLAGFSQGGALALYTGLTFEHKLAGIVGLSCYLFRFDENYSPENKTTPVFLAHGSQDPIVPQEYGQSAKQRLLDKSYNVDWHIYSMQHRVCASEVQDIKKFIESAFSLRQNIK